MNGKVAYRERKVDVHTPPGLKEYVFEGRERDRFTSQTDGIVLVRRYAEPHHDVLKALNDKKHMRYSEQRHRDHTVTTQRRYLDNMIIGGHLTLGIFIEGDRKDFDRLVGTMSCLVDKQNKLLDMGLLMLPKYAGQGYGRLAWKLVLDWALDGDRGGFEKVEAGHHEHNIGMLTICKATMEPDGWRSAHFKNDDGSRSAVQYWGKTP